MNWIVMAIGFIAILVLFMVITICFVFKKKNCLVYISRKIVHMFKPSDYTQDISEMIEFHKKSQHLNKYNIYR